MTLPVQHSGNRKAFRKGISHTRLRIAKGKNALNVYYVLDILTADALVFFCDVVMSALINR